MKIKNRIISENYPPFIVAEISANHNNRLSRALKLIDEAKKAGADAVKIQTYKADTITMKSKNKNFLIKDKNSLWNGKYLYDLYKQGSTPWEWHKEIFERVCLEQNLNASDTLFIDDSIQHIEGAKEAGLKTHHLLKQTDIYSLFS